MNYKFFTSLVLFTITTHFVHAADNPFAAFKLLGETTDCSVPRLAQNAPETKDQLIDDSGGQSISDEEAREAYQCAIVKMQAAYARIGHETAATGT